MNPSRARSKGAKVPGAKGRGARSGTIGKLRRLDLKWMARNDPPEPDFLVELVAARGEVTLLWGSAGIGKSLLTEALGRGVACGEDVAGLACKRGHVLFIDAENGANEIHRRVHQLGLPAARVAIWDASEGVHLVTDYSDIVQIVEREKPDLVVFDSLRRLTPGSQENDSDVMADAIAHVKQIAQTCGVAVILIHHARKDESIYRGSSALRDQVSVSWKLGRDSQDSDRDRRYLDCDKMRIAPEPNGRLWLRIVRDHGTVRMEADGAPPQRTVSGRQRADIADQILKMLDQEPMTRPALARALGRQAKDGTVRRALAELQEVGLVESQAKGKWRRVPTEISGVAENGTS